MKVSYADLHELYASSLYGAHHAEQPLRFNAVYGYDRPIMLEDLGDDVHPVRHMSYTASEIVKPFTIEQNLSGSERFSIIQATALEGAGFLHDMGECEHPEIREQTGYSIGDIPWALKTSEDGLSETVIRRYLYGKLCPGISLDEFDLVDDAIDHKEGSLVREAFNAIERLGYYKTALRAGEIALRLLEYRTNEDEVRFFQLGRLAVQVTNDHRQTLWEQSDRFPYLKTLLKANVLLDERIHSSIVSSATLALEGKTPL